VTHNVVHRLQQLLPPQSMNILKVSIKDKFKTSSYSMGHSITVIAKIKGMPNLLINERRTGYTPLVHSCAL
jgi:hypothetical protein